MTSVFTLCFCLAARILFGYLVESYRFFLNMQKIMEITVKVFGALCIVTAVWAFAMLVWELVKQITKVKNVNVPIINKYYGHFETSKKKPPASKKAEKAKKAEQEFPINEPLWDEYYDGGDWQ